MRAALLVREHPHYRRDAFCAGLEACGYTLGPELAKPAPEDLLVIWNRYGEGERLARHYEAHGARVLVAENGYLGRDWHEGIWYSLALSWNAGAGQWPIGGVERAGILRDDVKPWRSGGSYVLVLAQRGIGSPPVAQAPGWHQRAAEAVKRAGHRVVIRDHPGRHQENVSLYQQLEGASAVVTWASGAAVKALLHGVPVFHGLPQWIGAPAARPFSPSLTAPFRGDRTEFFTRLAWAMWTVEEIGSGVAFDHLLRGPAQGLQPGGMCRVC